MAASRRTPDFKAVFAQVNEKLANISDAVTNLASAQGATARGLAEHIANEGEKRQSEETLQSKLEDLGEQLKNGLEEMVVDISEGAPPAARRPPVPPARPTFAPRSLRARRSLTANLLGWGWGGWA